MTPARPCTRCGLPRERPARSFCRECEREYARERRAAAPERTRALKAARIYRVPLPKVLEWREERSCDICGAEQDVLAIDHCHSTGKVRGLLCDPCNTFLGRLERRRGELGRYLAYLDGVNPLHEERNRDQADPAD